MTQEKWRNILESEEHEFLKFQERQEILMQKHEEETRIRAKKNLEIFNQDIERLNEILKDFYLSFENPVTHNTQTALLKGMLGFDIEEIKKEQSAPVYMVQSSLELMYDSEGKKSSDDIMIMAGVGFENFSYSCTGNLMPYVKGDPEERKSYSKFDDLVNDFLKHYKRQIILHKLYMQKNK